MKTFIFGSLFCFFARQVLAGDAVAIGYKYDGVWTAVTYNRSSTPKGGPHYHDAVQACTFAVRDLHVRASDYLVRTEIVGQSDRTGYVAVAQGKAVVQRTADTRQHRALHGLVRNEIRNMVEGVTKGFERVLEINGVGYKAALSGRTLSLNLGFTHPISFPLPEGIEAKVDKQTVVTIKGRDRYLVGQIAANIRALKRPDVYKAKGVKYAGEILIRKEGKTGK